MPLLKRTALSLALATLLAAPGARAQQAGQSAPPSLEGYWTFKAERVGSTCPGLFGSEFHGSEVYEMPVEIQQRDRTVRLRAEGEQAEGRIKGDTMTFVSTGTAMMEACEVQSRSVTVLKIQGGLLSGTQKEYSLCMPGVKCPFDQCTSDARVTMTRIASKDAYNTALSQAKARFSKSQASVPKVTREAARTALGDYCR